MFMVLIALSAQAADTSAPHRGIVERGRELAGSPARDVGVAKTTIPPALARAAQNPYATAGTENCRDLAAGLRSLNGALGPDFAAGAAPKESRAGRLAEAGGQSLVNGLVPFRGLVREVSGAAAAQRRLNAAINAGYARRGFLRGLAVARKCPVK